MNLISGIILCRRIWLQRRKENRKKVNHRSLPLRLLLTVLARSVIHQPSFQTWVWFRCQRLPSLHHPQKHDCILSLKPQSKQKERKLLGSRNNWKHKFRLNKPHLKQIKLRFKKTNLCYARPKKRWRGCRTSLKRLMHCCELCWIFRKMLEVGLHDVWVDDAFCLVFCCIARTANFIVVGTMCTLWLETYVHLMCICWYVGTLCDETWNLLIVWCLNQCVMYYALECMWMMVSLLCVCFLTCDESHGKSMLMQWCFFCDNTESSQNVSATVDRHTSHDIT